MTVQIQVIPASSSLGTSGGLVAGTGCSVFISQDHFDTALDIVAQAFQEQIGVFSSEIHFTVVVTYILILCNNYPIMPISVLIIHTTG